MRVGGGNNDNRYPILALQTSFGSITANTCKITTKISVTRGIFLLHVNRETSFNGFLRENESLDNNLKSVTFIWQNKNYKYVNNVHYFNNTENNIITH